MRKEFKLNSKRSLHFFMPERIIADVKYPNNSIHDKELRKVRFLLSPVKNSNNHYFLLVIAHSSISPMQYPYETFLLLKEFLSTYDIEFDSVDIVLDYTERTGKDSGSPSKWIFKVDRSGEYLEDIMTGLDNELQELTNTIRWDYFKEFNIKIS